MGLPEKLGKVGVIFDSGAFYGAFGVGAAKAIWGCGIRPVALGGTSVGALNAVKIAENNSPNGVKALEEIWLNKIEKVGSGSVFSTLSIIKNKFSWRNDPPSIYGSAELRALVSPINLDIGKVIASDTLVQIVVTEKSTYEYKLVSNRDDEIKKNPEFLRDYTQASSSVPGIFPPPFINHHFYTDGLIFAPLLDSFATFNCDTIFVIMNDQKLDLDHSNDSPAAEIFRAIRSLQNDVNKSGIQDFLEKHPDFHPFDYEAEDDDPPILKGLKKIKNWFTTTIVEGNFDGIQHRLIVIFPHCRIQTLYATKFKKGDISLAIQKSYEETKRILDKLENK